MAEKSFYKSLKDIAIYQSIKDKAFYQLLKEYWEEGGRLGSNAKYAQTLWNKVLDISKVFKSQDVQGEDLASFIKEKGYELILENVYGYDLDILKESPQGRLQIEFYRNLPKWYLHNGDDCVICYGFDDHYKLMIKNGFGISRDETLLFERDTSKWSTNDQGLVISDKSIHVIVDKKDPNTAFEIEWQAIEKVIYKEEIFYFSIHGDSEVPINWNYFFKGDFPGTERCENLANILTKLAQIVDIVPDAFELYEAGKVDEALATCESLISSENVDEQYNGHYCKGYILYKTEEAKKKEGMDADKLSIAQKELETAYKLTSDESRKSIIQYLLGFVKAYQDDFSARDSFILGMESTDNDIRESSYEVLNNIEDSDSYEEVWDNYVTILPYKDRQFIMPVKDKDIGGCVADGIDVFRMSNIPSCIKFPIGHPIANQLYIGHPYNPSLYFPYEESEESFFVDKVHELCYLLQCLGAEEIDITSIKGKTVEEISNNSIGVKGSADIKAFSGDGNVQMSKNLQSQGNDKRKQTMKMTFDPTTKPFVPNGLVWYEEQPKWRHLVQSRMQGNMLAWSEFVSSSSTRFVSDAQKKDITANARYLWAKVHADVNVEANSQLKRTEDTEWKIEVRFRSTKLLEEAPAQKQVEAAPVDKQIETKVQAQQPTLSDDEAKYLDEVKFCLEDDGQIDAKERTFLERIRNRYSITPERATEIEEMALPKQTNDEQEYLDAVKDALVDGEISPRGRRLLDRLRDSFGISEERAEQLENTVMK